MDSTEQTPQNLENKRYSSGSGSPHGFSKKLESVAPALLVATKKTGEFSSR